MPGQVGEQGWTYGSQCDQDLSMTFLCLWLLHLTPEKQRESLQTGRGRNFGRVQLFADGFTSIRFSTRINEPGHADLTLAGDNPARDASKQDEFAQMPGW